MTNCSFFQIDAFARKAFEGNPAAVCLLDADWADSAWAQSVAAEMNLSETAFVAPDSAGGEDLWNLRWFTPTSEVDLCGHATLAAAHALWESGRADLERAIRFSTRSGVLTARRVGSAIELDFPARPARSVQPPAELLEALGIMPTWVGKSGEDDYMLVVEDVAAVAGVTPDLWVLAQLEARGVIVTAGVGPGDSGVPVLDDRVPDFVSRFFAPSCGVPEDPVTGSAHCTLGPYWAERLHRDTLLAYQMSSRGGFVELEVQSERVLLRGHAVTVVSGELVG